MPYVDITSLLCSICRIHTDGLCEQYFLYYVVFVGFTLLIMRASFLYQVLFVEFTLMNYTPVNYSPCKIHFSIMLSL